MAKTEKSGQGIVFDKKVKKILARLAFPPQSADWKKVLGKHNDVGLPAIIDSKIKDYEQRKTV